MKQFLPKKTCLQCQGCCRFAEAATVWLPGLLDKEIKALSKAHQSIVISRGKKLQPIPAKNKEIFFCPFLNPQDNKCRIYSSRPFECRLYPFVVNRSSGKVYLGVDANCPFIREKLEDALFKEHVAYLAGLLNSRPFRSLLKDNPQIIQSYPEAVNLAEIKVAL
jgi:Fe-S-cluster containining protein